MLGNIIYCRGSAKCAIRTVVIIIISVSTEYLDSIYFLILNCARYSYDLRLLLKTYACDWSKSIACVLFTWQQRVGLVHY